MIIYIYLRARWSTNNSNLDGKKTIFLKSLSYNLHPRKKCWVSLYDNFCTLIPPIIMWYSDV